MAKQYPQPRFWERLSIPSVGNMERDIINFFLSLAFLSLSLNYTTCKKHLIVIHDAYYFTGIFHQQPFIYLETRNT